MKDSRGVVLVVAFLGAAFGIGMCWGGDQREEEIRADQARAISRAKDSVRDSIGNAVLQKAREDSITGAAVVAALVYEKNQATRATNLALAQASSVRERASQTLADTAASLQRLRGSLREAVATIDTLEIRLLDERNARERERHVADSIYSASRANLLKDFTAYRESVARSDSAKVKAWTADVQRASGSGKRTGRVQGFIGGLLTVAAVVYAVK